MSSNESEDFEDPETEQTQVFQSDQDEMHFYQDEKLKNVSSTEKRCSQKQGEVWTRWRRPMTRIF